MTRSILPAAGLPGAAGRSLRGDTGALTNHHIIPDARNTGVIQGEGWMPWVNVDRTALAHRFSCGRQRMAVDAEFVRFTHVGEWHDRRAGRMLPKTGYRRSWPHRPTQNIDSEHPAVEKAGRGIGRFWRVVMRWLMLITAGMFA